MRVRVKEGRSGNICNGERERERRERKREREDNL